MRMIHLVHYAQQAPQEHHTLGKCPKTCMMTWNCSFPHLGPYRWSTGIFDSYGDPWDHWCATTPIGSTTGILLGEQGATPLSITFWGVYSSLWNFWTLSGLLEGPTTCIYYYLTSWEAYYFISELVWWACHQKLVYLHIILFLGANVGSLAKSNS